MKNSLSFTFGKGIGGSSFEWINPRSPRALDLDPRRGEGTAEFVARLPLSSRWIRSSLVERQTVSTDVQWQPRLMVLTDTDIYFAKPDSDIVLDKLPLRNVTFFGKVDTAQSALIDQGMSAASGRIDRLSKKIGRHRNSVKFSAALKMERIGDLQASPRFSLFLNANSLREGHRCKCSTRATTTRTDFDCGTRCGTRARSTRQHTLAAVTA